MQTRTPTPQDVWAHERAGYVHIPRASYAPAPRLGCKKTVKWVRAEERISSLMAGAGLVWTAQIATSHASSLDALWRMPGPLEASGIGILIWLHAKWRRSVAIR